MPYVLFERCIMSSFKEMLKKIYPSPASSFNREIGNLKKRIKSLEDSNGDLEKRIEHLMYNQLDPALYPHAIKQWYQDVTGNVLDLSSPRTYNEKIQWLKAYDHDPRKTLLADKYLVRDWVRDKIGEEYLIPLLGVYRNANEIDFDSLPDKFVLKGNHGSSMNYIVTNKKKENFEEIRNIANGWLRQNFAFSFGYEMHYNDIPRRLIAEQYIGSEGVDLPDYKFWCFGGKCRFIGVHKYRYTDPHMVMFSPEWEKLSFSTGASAPLEEDVKRPSVLPEMLRIAEKLSEGFTHVRVDLYLLNDRDIKFGEMTFTPSSGVCRWTPPETDLMVGEMLELPDKTNVKD